MDYHQVRAVTVRNAYAATIRKFFEGYDPQRPIVVLLPGGMGSQLDRSSKPFDQMPRGFEDYTPVWMDDGILFNADGLTLEMDREERDKDSHIVVPNGPLRYLISAYDGTAAWASESGFNYIVFGYDWRRPIDEAAGYLVYFLGQLRDEARARGFDDPLLQTTLLAHSQGGLVCKIFMHYVEAEIAAWCARVITVGTPFYGTWSHMDRFYVGQRPLDLLHGKRRVAQIAATLPGPYVLLYLDQETYNAHYKELGFASIDDYPMVDEQGRPADPCAPGSRGRYPDWVRTEYLDRAKQIRGSIALKLEPAAIERVFNFRADKEQTPDRLTWRQIPPDFDPDEHGSPVRGALGPGDGTVPAWAAFMPQTHADQRLTLTTAKVHQDLLEHVEVLNAAGALIDPGYANVSTADPGGIFGRSAVTASPGEVDALIDDVIRGRAGRGDSRTYNPAMWRGIYGDLKR